MRVKSLMTVGFLSVLAATAGVNASVSVAADVHRVDVIDDLHQTVAQKDSVKAGSGPMRVDVIDSIPSEGPVYAYTKSTRVDVIDSIGSEGPGQPYAKAMSH